MRLRFVILSFEKLASRKIVKQLSGVAELVVLPLIPCIPRAARVGMPLPQAYSSLGLQNSVLQRVAQVKPTWFLRLMSSVRKGQASRK